MTGHVVTPVTPIYLQSLRPEMGPHEHNAVAEIGNGTRGCGRRFSLLAVRDGVPESAYWLESRFRDRRGGDFTVHETEQGAATWSWGLGGIVATSAYAAECFARSVLGDQFRGWVQ